LLDSNLSVLLSVGSVGVARIRTHKRLSGYEDADYDLLREILRTGSGVVFIPHVVSETSGLARQTGSPLREHVTLSLRALLENADEFYVASREAGRDLVYPRLGITDAALLCALRAQQDITLLTADHDLYLAAMHRRLDAVNFNHVREQQGGYR
jgi:hypothetical protein